MWQKWLNYMVKGGQGRRVTTRTEQAGLTCCRGAGSCPASCDIFTRAATRARMQAPHKSMSSHTQHLNLQQIADTACRAGCSKEQAAAAAAVAATGCKLHAAACLPVARYRLLFTAIAGDVAVLHNPQWVVAAQGFANCCIFVRGLVRHIVCVMQPLEIPHRWCNCPDDMHAMQTPQQAASAAGG